MHHRTTVQGLRSTMGWMAMAVILLASLPTGASAQFGRLKQLKNKVSPDSATKLENAVRDSIALAEKVAAGDTTPLGRSKFARAVSAVSAASEKFEQVTGVSAKDAALMASGVGAGNLLSKKLGVDPMSLGANALRGRGGKVNGASVLELLKGNQGSQSIPGMPNMAELMKMQRGASSSASMSPGASPRAPTLTHSSGDVSLGLSEADARAIAAFQQEMMQVAMAASNGDAAAQAKLERWEAIALKYQPEIEKLTLAASGGDYAAVQKLQVIQINILKEWANTGSGKAGKLAVSTKVPKAAKAAKPAANAKP